MFRWKLLKMFFRFPLRARNRQQWEQKHSAEPKTSTHFIVVSGNTKLTCVPEARLTLWWDLNCSESSVSKQSYGNSVQVLIVDNLELLGLVRSSKRWNSFMRWMFKSSMRKFTKKADHMIGHWIGRYRFFIAFSLTFFVNTGTSTSYLTFNVMVIE